MTQDSCLFHKRIKHKPGLLMRLPGGIVCALLVWLMGMSAWVQAQPAVNVDGEHFNHRLTTEVWFLEDAGGALQLADVMQAAWQDRFQPFAGDTLQFGYSHSAYWLRVLLHNPLSAPRPLWLEIRYPLLDSVTFYAWDAQGELHVGKGGDGLPVTQRKFQVKDFHFPLTLAAGQSRWVYVRVQSTSSLSVPFFVSTEAGMVESHDYLQWWDGLYFGVAFAMVFYNLSLLLLIRERIYFEYVLFVLLMVGFITSISGYLSVLTPNNQWFINHGIYLFSSGIAVFLTQFTRTYLQVPEKFPRIDRVYKGFMIFSLLAVLAETLLPPGVAAKINALTVLTGILLLWPLGVYRYFTGYRPARYYALGQSAFLLAVVFTTLASQNLLPFYYLAPWMMKLGSACELMLFSIGLADRISEYKEREDALVREQQVARAESAAQEKYIAEINRINSRLEQAVQARSEFLANMSHEIRTPMNGILGMLELIDDKGLASTQRSYINIARRSGKTLLALINDVLDLSKIESGKMDLDEQPFSLTTFIQDLTSLYEHQLRDKHLAFELKAGSLVPEGIAGDRTRLWQVMTNLISNAIKFTSQGGVQIGVERMEGDEPRLRFSVRDTGIGIAKDKQSLIFESFRQADGTTTRLFGGTGLGLSISRKLVQLMGGELRVDSEQGKDSEFHFEIPCREVCLLRQAGELSPGARLQDIQAMRVLLVEDNPVNQKVAQGILKKIGVRHVCVAGNGMEALQKLQDEQFDLVFMDVQMPEMDGFEATRRIRQSSAPFAEVVIVAMTANALDGDRERCMSAGMTDYLSKPVQKDAVQDMLLRHGRRKD